MIGVGVGRGVLGGVLLTVGDGAGGRGVDVPAGSGVGVRVGAGVAATVGAGCGAPKLI